MSETEVVVLPSPALVGVIAVTQTSFASGLSASLSIDREVDLRLVATVQVVLVGLEAVALGNVSDRLEGVGLCDIEVRGDLGCHSLSLGRQGRRQCVTEAAAASETSVSV